MVPKKEFDCKSGTISLGLPFEELQTYHTRVNFDFGDEKWYEDNLSFGKTEVESLSWSQNESNSSLGYVREQTLPDPSNRLIYPILNDRIGRVSIKEFIIISTS